MDPKARLTAALPSGTETLFPTSDHEACQALQRWSNLGVTKPFAIVIPATEEQVIAAVQFAASAGMQVLVGGGGRGPYVPVDSKLLYLDLRKFNSITVDESKSCVTVGGAATTGDTYKVCAAHGLYTQLPNANSVGVVGSILGGGSSPFNSLHGFAADQVISLRLVTAKGEIVDLDPTANDDAKHALFKILGRTGYGFGVVTSMTMKAWRISSLNMKEDKVWARTLIFPPNAIQHAAQAFCKVQPLVPRFQATLIFNRNPQNGNPMCILSASFLGPEDEAQKIAAPLLEPALEQQAVVANTSFIPLENLNNSSEPLNTPGEYKELYTCLVKEIDQESITNLWQSFVKFGEDHEDARKRSYIVVASWNCEALLKNAKMREDLKYVRDRGIFAQIGTWYSSPSTKTVADEFGTKGLKIVRRADHEKGVPDMSFAHSLHLGQDLKGTLSEDMISDYKQIKKTWDPDNIFWSPLTDKEHFSLD